MKKTNNTDASPGSSSKTDKTMKESDSNTIRKSRRRLIQVLVAGGVVVTAKSVPNTWSRPVVNSVMLPAHARTSGELITLGNDPNFQSITQNLEQQESLLASGVESGWDEVLDTLVQQGHAQDDSQVFCEFTGCSYIEYYSGANTGQLFISIMDNTADNIGPRELVLPFTDGQLFAANEACLLTGSVHFLVELQTDTLAYLTIYLQEGTKPYRENIELVPNPVCNPVTDGVE